MHKGTANMALSPWLASILRHDAPHAWVLRHNATHSSRFYPLDIARYDRQLNEYLHLLEYEALDGADTLSRVDHETQGGLFIHLTSAIQQSNWEHFITLLSELSDDSEQGEELAQSLAWFPVSVTHSFIQYALEHSSPVVQAAAINASAARGVDLPVAEVASYLGAQDHRITIAALRYLGNRKYHVDQLMSLVNTLLTSQHEGVRFNAIRAVLLLGDRERVSLLQSYVTQACEYTREAIQLIYPLFDIAQQEALTASILSADLSPTIKLYALAVSGDTGYVPTIIEWASQADYARLAGESFAFITGIDIEEENLCPVIEDEDESELQNLDNINVRRKQDPWAQAYESDLPIPSAERLQAWWSSHQEEFKKGQRWIAGKPYSQENLNTIATEGNQRQQRVAEIALALSYPGSYVHDLTLPVGIG